LFLMAVSGLAMASSIPSLHLGMLPWTDATLIYLVFFSALFGLIAVALAVLGKLRVLFFVWSLVVAGFMVKGYIFSGYRFSPGEASTAMWLILAALVSIAGAWFQLWAPARRFKRY
jgi:hypothetical protein